jgi:hypothetical protein
MRRLHPLPPLAMLAMLGCGDPDRDDTGPGDQGLDPAGDEDGDGYTNADEQAAGSDPYDLTDVPYAGGWRKGIECNDSIEPTGNELGQVAHDFQLQDQHGELVSLWDFCDRVVLIEFAGFS